MRIGDEAIMQGIAPELLTSAKAEEARQTVEALLRQGEQLEANEGICWVGGTWKTP